MNYCPYCMQPVTTEYGFCTHCGKSKSHIAPVHHLLAGTVLQQRYMIGAALGEGGCGITYIGRDLNLDMVVAIKEYFPNGFVSRSNKHSPTVDQATTVDRRDFFEKGCEKFLKEARILAKFSSETGIVNVRDFFEQNNTAYIVMEYLKGETLKDLIKRRGKLPANEVLQMLAPVMASLQKVHGDGLIHRDISPDNIMLVHSGAKLLDFGAARDISAMGNKSLSIMLKPGYAPEEQYRIHGEQGPWTDVYALCATVYKCITGITPDDSIERNFRDNLKPPSQLGIAISPIIESAIMRGLAINRADRYRNINELLDGLRGIQPRQEKNNSADETVIIPKLQHQSHAQSNRTNPYAVYQNANNYNPNYNRPPAGAAPAPTPIQNSASYIPPVHASLPNPNAINRAAFSVPPAPRYFRSPKIWSPLVCIILAAACHILLKLETGDSFKLTDVYLGTSAAACIFTAIAMQVSGTQILSKIARWIDFALIALSPIISFLIFTPYGYYLEPAPAQLLRFLEFIFIFVSLGTYYKRCTAQRLTVTESKSNLQTIALASILFISFALMYRLPIVLSIYDPNAIAVIGFMIVYALPLLSLAQSEKHLPNGIWITGKVFSIIFVSLYGIFAVCMVSNHILGTAFLTEFREYSPLSDFMLLCDDFEFYTYYGYEHFLNMTVFVTMEALYVAALAANIDIAHSNIYRKPKNR